MQSNTPTAIESSQWEKLTDANAACRPLEAVPHNQSDVAANNIKLEPIIQTRTKNIILSSSVNFFTSNLKVQNNKRHLKIEESRYVIK